MFRFAWLVLLLTLLHRNFTAAQEPPEYISEYAEQSTIQRFQAMADGKRNLAAVRENAQRAMQLGRPKREAMKSIKEAEERANQHAAKLSDPLEPYFGTIPLQGIKTGSIGRLNWIDAMVFQVIDDENMLVELSWQASVIKHLNSSDAATKGNVYDGVEQRTLLVWVRGIDTSGLVDNKGLDFQGVQPQGVFAVRETETYPTRAGSKTVPMLEEVDMSPWEHLFTMCGEMRTWTDDSGKHSIEASFVDYKGGQVELMGANDKRSRLKLSELSEKDQQYVREEMKERRKLMRAADR